MATYAYVTLATAQSDLASRLYDPTMQFWSPAELTVLLQEALRTWNAFTGQQRGDFTLPSTQGTVFYDLTAAAASLRPYTVTDQSLYESMEYSLLEPLTATYPLTWTGSRQFSIANLIAALQRRRDETLATSGCTLTRIKLPVTPGYTRNAVPDTTLAIRRVVYQPVAGFGLPSSIVLWPEDTWSLDSFDVGYATASNQTPSTFRVTTEPTLTFDTDVPPAIPGSYELLVVQSGATLSAAAPSTLSIPDDWTWLLRWGSLMDLLGTESNAKDPLRAKYCEGRYRQGLELLAAAPATLGLRVNGVPLRVDAVRSADLYQTGWEAHAPGPATEALTAGLNLVALNPPPDAGPYSLTATVVQNAPVPVLATDFLQVDRGAYDAILDYAQHLAAFKMGGQEFMATVPLYSRFLWQASLAASRIDESGEFAKLLYGQSQLESNMNPEYTPDLDPAEAAS
jgi:hypothetical protein